MSGLRLLASGTN